MNYEKEAVWARSSYEGASGGWADGRLGQAYDIVYEIKRDKPEWKSEVDRLLLDIEGLDRDMQKELTA
jgi:hypothetical protein